VRCVGHGGGVLGRQEYVSCQTIERRGDEAKFPRYEAAEAVQRLFKLGSGGSLERDASDTLGFPGAARGYVSPGNTGAPRESVRRVAPNGRTARRAGGESRPDSSHPKSRSAVANYRAAPRKCSSRGNVRVGISHLEHINNEGPKWGGKATKADTQLLSTDGFVVLRDYKNSSLASERAIRLTELANLPTKMSTEPGKS
jgi:hypothetical protein